MKKRIADAVSLQGSGGPSGLVDQAQYENEGNCDQNELEDLCQRRHVFASRL